MTAILVKTSSARVPGGLLRKIFPLLFAICYATILASLPIDVFKDRANYLIYAQLSEDILARYEARGLLTVLANEPLWLYINIGLNQIVNPDMVLRVIIFVSAFIVSFLLVRKNPYHMLWMVAFLLMPQVLKNHITHLRQGLALSVFLLGYYAGNKWVRICLMFAACFIHTTFLFIAALGLGIWGLSRLRLPSNLQVALFVLSFTLLGIALTTFAELGFTLITIADSLGARQGAAEFETAIDTSGFGFIFWAMILLFFILAGKDFLSEQLFPSAILIFYLLLYFLTPVSARIFESGLFIVLTAGLALPTGYRYAFIGSMAFYTLLQYAMRLNEPWLGWGIYL